MLTAEPSTRPQGKLEDQAEWRVSQQTASLGNRAQLAINIERRANNMARGELRHDDLTPARAILGSQIGAFERIAQRGYERLDVARWNEPTVLAVSDDVAAARCVGCHDCA